MGPLNSHNIKIQALSIWRCMSDRQTFGLTPVAVLVDGREICFHYQLSLTWNVFKPGQHGRSRGSLCAGRLRNHGLISNRGIRFFIFTAALRVVIGLT